MNEWIPDPPAAPDGGMERMEGAPAGQMETYTVQPGDKLSDIAARLYGEVGAWERIYEANREKLETPDAIAPGQELLIPR